LNDALASENFGAMTKQSSMTQLNFSNPANLNKSGGAKDV